MHVAAASSELLPVDPRGAVPTVPMADLSRHALDLFSTRTRSRALRPLPVVGAPAQRMGPMLRLALSPVAASPLCPAGLSARVRNPLQRQGGRRQALPGARCSSAAHLWGRESRRTL